MGRMLAGAALLAAAMTLAACAAPSQTPTTSRPEGAAPSVQRTLVVMVSNEPENIDGRAGTVGRPHKVDRWVRGMSTYQFPVGGAWNPSLVTHMPQVNTSDWVLHPDGRMEITWRLKPGLTWHDGEALTAGDFLFERRVTRSREHGFLESQSPFLDDVVQVDDLSWVYRWNSPFIAAGTTGGNPLPRHILETAFDRDSPQAFAALPHWTNEYIGAGAYKLERWERGAFIEVSAFQNFAQGKPKIDLVRFIWVPDGNVAAAQLLAGTAHFAPDTTILFEQGSMLSQQCAHCTLIWGAEHVRYAQFQWRPDYVGTPALADVRVRRAMLKAMDRPELISGLFEGKTAVADTFISRDVPYYSRVDAALDKHAYDVRAAEQLMNDAGYFRGADSLFAKDDQQLKIHFLSDNAQEMVAMGNIWKRAGFEMDLQAIPGSQVQNQELRSTFPGIAHNSLRMLPELNSMTFFSSRNIPSPTDRWAASNRGGFSNDEFQRLYDAYSVEVAPDKATDTLISALGLLSQTVSALPMFPYPIVYAQDADLKTPLKNASYAGQLVPWEWEWTR